MPDLIYPVDLSNGTLADADEVMSNFNAIKALLEGLLARDNLDPSLSNALFVPPGIIADYGGSAAPAGWLLCDGSSVARSTYPDLFTAIGTTYGSADGAHFTLPDYRGRVAVMEDGAAGRLSANDARGQSAGEEKHVLITAELAAHNHGGVTGSPSTAPYAPQSDQVFAGEANTVYANPPFHGAAAFNQADFVHTHSIASQGSGTPHNNMPPYLVANRIIKT